MSPVEVTFEQVEQELLKRNFGILSTITQSGRSHSVGIIYSVSPPREPLLFYLITGRKTRKARNIIKNPNVSFAIPLPIRFLTFIPPRCIQFQGIAAVIPVDDEKGRDAFKRSRILKHALKYIDKNIEEKEKICFIRICPDPVIFTHGLGLSLMERRKHLEEANSKVEIPLNRRCS